MSGPRAVTGARIGDRWIVPIAWSIASQGLSSATNFGLTVLLTIGSDADELGRILSLVSIYLLALTVSRSLITESMVAAAPGAAGVGPTTAVADVVWTSTRARLLAAAAPAMVVGVAVALALDVDRMIAVLVLGSMPVLLIQDGQRYLAWAVGRPRAATVLDGCWFVVSAGWLAVGWLLGAGLDSAAVVGAWVAGAGVSWIVGRCTVEPTVGLRARSGPGRPSARRSMAAPGGRELRYRRLAKSQALFAVAVNLGPVVVALVFSPVSTAAVKVVLVPFTVILSLAAGVRVVTLPALRRAVDRDGGGTAVLRLTATAGTVAAAGALLSLRLVHLLPVGRFGQPLAAVRPYLLLGAVLCVLYVVGQQLSDASALHGGVDVVARRLTAIGAEWGGLMIGAAVAGVGGLMVGWTIGLAVATAIWAVAWLHRPRHP